MSNNKDFILSNPIEVGGSTKVTIGTVSSSYSSGYWDIDTAVTNYSFDTTGFSYPAGLYFKPDGTKMYVVSGGTDGVYEYDLSTAWDISTASYVTFFSVLSEDGNATGVFFKPDGTKMYVVGTGADSALQYDLSTAWDISTASFSQSQLHSGVESAATGIFFKPDGTLYFVVGQGSDFVREFTPVTAWNVSGANNTGSYSVVTETPAPQDLYFKSDGTVMYVVATTGVHEYSLSTAWDVTTASLVKTLDISAVETAPQSLYFKDDGSKMYIGGGSAPYTITEFNLGVYDRTLDLSTGNYFVTGSVNSISFSNPSDVQSFQLELGKSGALTWPASIEWNLGATPASPGLAEKHLYTFVTDDGGTTYIGLHTADNLS